MVVVHIPMVHTYSLTCTNDIGMMAHTVAFQHVGEHSSKVAYSHVSELSLRGLGELLGEA